MGKKENSSSCSEYMILYTDGACRGNPGPGGWAAIILSPSGQVHELGSFHPSTTNNRMEMTAALEALKALPAAKPAVLLTDSTYLIRGALYWAHGWQKRGWKTAQGEAVQNQDLWQKLLEELKKRKVEWRYVRGHAGIPGNERCDQLAVAFSQGEIPHLYRGHLKNYPHATLELPPFEPLPEMKSNASEKKSVFGYISYVQGEYSFHQSWAACEQAVKGRPNARFKKALTREQAQRELESWGATKAIIERLLPAD